jgi:hypothetical protein
MELARASSDKLSEASSHLQTNQFVIIQESFFFLVSGIPEECFYSDPKTVSR